MQGVRGAFYHDKVPYPIQSWVAYCLNHKSANSALYYAIIYLQTSKTLLDFPTYYDRYLEPLERSGKLSEEEHRALSCLVLWRFEFINKKAHPAH